MRARHHHASPPHAQHQPQAHAASRATAKADVPSILAGIIAGCVTRSCTSPLDVLKIVLQVPPVPARPPAMAASITQMTSMQMLLSASPPPMQMQVRMRVLTTAQSIYATHGLAGFWRGNAASCWRFGPYAGAKFFLFDALQERWLQRYLEDGQAPTSAQHALCGAIAGLLATLATYPVELVRTRRITQMARESEIRGVAQGLALICRREGWRGLFRGVSAGMVGAIPFEGVQFGCYEYLKHAIRARKAQLAAASETEDEAEADASAVALDARDYLLCGSAAGVVAQLAAYPFDTVKKRLQTHPRGVSYDGMLDCFAQIARQEGIGALYRGSLPNLARVVPHAALMFTTYELARDALRAVWQAQREGELDVL